MLGLLGDICNPSLSIPQELNKGKKNGFLKNKKRYTHYDMAIDMYMCTQLPHSYYFTTPILFLKFANKGVFFEEIEDSHFPRKRGYFGTHLREFGKKGLILMSSVLGEKGCSFGLKS